MKKKILSLVLALVMSLALCAPAALANTYTADDINSILGAISNYIGENEDALKANISGDDDKYCGYAINLAAEIANLSEQNYDVSYELIYSVYAYIMLVVNNDSTKDEAIDLYTRVANDFITDEYFKIINPRADEEKIKNLISEKKYDELYDSLCDAVYKYILYIVYQAESLLPANEQISAEQKNKQVFEDVTENDWFYSAVSYVYAMGLFKGTSETQFSPQLTMTRGMFVTVLSRFAADKAFESTKAHGYADVSDDAYYKPAVAWAKEAGLIGWAEGDKFYPDRPVTREEMVSSMYKFAENTGSVGEFSSIISNVTDKDQISVWAVDGMDWAYGTGVIKGYGDGTVKPNGTAARAEVAQVFLNFFAVISITNSNNNKMQ